MSATRSLFERRDVIIVASVSCIYGIGSPEAYYGMMLMLEKGQRIARESILRKLVEIQYERAEDLRRGTFRVRGDMIEIYPPYDDFAVRIELWGSQIEAIRKIDPLTGEIRSARWRNRRACRFIRRRTTSCPPRRENAPSRPSTKSSTGGSPSSSARENIVEAQRVCAAHHFDIEMMRTIGYCHGIENYSRHMSGRLPGEAPPTLLDYFPSGLFCSSSTNRTRPFRSFAACITATARASRRSWTTASACPRRSTIAR